MARELKKQYELKGTLQQVWKALTDPATLAKWVMPNDFRPVVGHKFQFRAQPVGGWDGIVKCEVLELEEHRRLSYTWASVDQNTVVTWTLKEEEGKTILYLEHSGFTDVGPALQGASYGWQRMVGQLESVLAEISGEA